METGYSPSTAVYTAANIPDAPAVSNATDTTLDVSISPNSNPYYTEYAIYNLTDNYYIDTIGGNNGTTPVWERAGNWGLVTVT